MSDFRYRTLDDFRAAYRDGRATPLTVAERFIEARNASEAHAPPMRIFIASDDDEILHAAKASTERLKKGKPAGPLDGIPIAVKDELHQVGYPTTGGTSFLGKGGEREDATVVARLRAAGAVLVGKTNMHEIGMGATGINPHHGAARNPYDPACITGGSSSGSGAVVGAGLVPAALGADGGGSVRIPAALCGAVGIKATFGRVPETGALPLCWSLAHIGPLAGTVADAAEILDLIVGEDPRDPNTHGQPPLDLRGLKHGQVKDLKIGVCPDFFDQASPEVVAVCRAALERLADDGAKIKDVRIRHLDLVRVTLLVTMGAEMAASQIENLREHRAEYGADTRLLLDTANRGSGPEYVHAQRARVRIERAFREVLESVDVLVSPTTGTVAVPIRRDAELYGEVDDGLIDRICACTFPGNLTGYPAVTVPAGFSPSALPIGLQIMAGPWDEGTALRVARAVERHVVRPAPKVVYDLLS
ncbi:MAG: amidase [Deltaproteobacteria bacterium]|nr:amidase [Deltaproteobacteria bacterium]